MLHVFIIAGEESGDRLGAALMRALRERIADQIRFDGVGGPEMAAQGVVSLFPMHDLALIGFSAIPGRIPTILRHLHRTVAQVVAQRPDVLVLIDNPEFNGAVARRVRAADPAVPIIKYVSPQVWAWRPGRARAMRAYIDHVLALLPFEPEILRRLGGPPCTYVGHPLVDQLPQLRPNPDEVRRRLAEPPVLLVLPGSRTGEVERLLGIFARTVDLVGEAMGPLVLVIPAVSHLADMIAAATQHWTIRPEIVVDPADKQAAFRIARAALAKSGTVTLELALAGVPFVAGYRISWLEALAARRMLTVSSVTLPNLVLGEKVVPELLQQACTPENLAAAMIPLLKDSPQRRHQCEAFRRLDSIMQIGSSTPALRAADIVLDAAGRALPRGRTPSQ